MSEAPGDPIAYTALQPGTPVQTVDGEHFATVQAVLVDEKVSVFDGIVVQTTNGTRFVDAIDLIPVERGNSSRSIFLVGRRGEFPTLSRDIAIDVRKSLHELLDSHSWLRPYVPSKGTDPDE